MRRKSGKRSETPTAGGNRRRVGIPFDEQSRAGEKFGDLPKKRLRERGNRPTGKRSETPATGGAIDGGGDDGAARRFRRWKRGEHPSKGVPSIVRYAREYHRLRGNQKSIRRGKHAFFAKKRIFLEKSLDIGKKSVIRLRRKVRQGEPNGSSKRGYFFDRRFAMANY